jgi:hypothetical protein
MLPEYRYFKCNMLGGFRLSDLNLQVKQEQYFHIDSHVAETSRAVQSALKAKWMVEVGLREASKHIDIPRGRRPRILDEAKPAINSVAKTGVAVPNINEVNKTLESRQAARQKEQEGEKPAIPNFVDAEKKIKARNEDTLSGNKTDNKIIDEVIASPAKAAAEAEKTAAKAEADEEGVTTIKSLSKDEEETTVADDLNTRIRRRRKEPAK